MTDKELKLLMLKAEIFDLQILFGKVRSDLEAKVKELNEFQKTTPKGDDLCRGME